MNKEPKNRVAEISFCGFLHVYERFDELGNCVKCVLRGAVVWRELFTLLIFKNNEFGAGDF